MCLIYINNVEMMKMSRADRMQLLIRGTPSEQKSLSIERYSPFSKDISNALEYRNGTRDNIVDGSSFF